MTTIIQNLIFPNSSVCGSEESYVRCYGGAACDVSRGIITIPAGGGISFDTFYNSFDIAFWKEHTAVEDLLFQLKGTGTVEVICYLAKKYLADQSTAEFKEVLSGDSVIPIESYSSNDSGKIFISIKALTDSTVESGSFLTTDAPQNAVKLGIVITHYDRKQYVLPTIERIEKEVTSKPEFRNRVELVVIDNSQNILPEEVDHSTVIRNENLGGSGGWARGLIYLKDNNFTHCLFADDDGCFEMECIKRLVSFYSFQKEGSGFAIAGTLLYQERANIIHAKGESCYGFRDRKNQHNKDIENFRNLLDIDSDSFVANYGAFCFFCFPLAEMKFWPFPFFVKGDDILFGCQNKFNILTISGIACYIDDFVEKRSALTDYLTYRGRYVRYVQYSQINLKEVLLNFTKKYFGVLFSYKYDSASAILLAHKQMLAGGDIFLGDIYLKKARENFGKQTLEKPREVSLENVETKRIGRENILRRYCRFLTLQGLFLPYFLFKKEKAIQQNRGSRARYRDVFLYRSVCYYSKLDNLGYITTHSKRKLIRGIIRWATNVVRTCFKLKSSIQKIDKLLADTTTEGFWRTVYSQLQDQSNVLPKTK